MDLKKNYNKHLTRFAGLAARFLILLLALFLSPAVPCSAGTASVSWRVTQYGDDHAGKQSMFYTIKGSNGRLIVIDGGWTDQEAFVRKTIRSLGGKVDLWIITHPHPDHAGAFIKIFSSPGDIRIRKVIAPKINDSRYRKYKHSWDEYPVFQQFMKLMSGTSKIHWKGAGDSFCFSGLKFQFFNGYSDTLTNTTKDICNGSSLVFKVSGRKTSMLFTGDILTKVGRRLINTYKKQLKSTYLQAPHHGNNTGRYSFYKYIGADITFVDAPAFLRTYPAVARNLQNIKALGGQVYTYNSSRRSVIIH